MLALSFLEPSRLWLLVLPVALLAGYLVSQVRRRGYVVRFTNMDLLDSVAPKRPRWRRHLPAIGLQLGLVALALSLAEPAVADNVADEQAVVVLALDTSLSMQATDVAPSRLDAAQEAARSFLDNVPDGVRVGLVGFDNGARLLVPPTDNVAVLERAVDRLDLGEGTAIGEAVFASLDAIDEALQTGEKASTAGAESSGTPAEDASQPAVVVLL